MERPRSQNPEEIENPDSQGVSRRSFLKELGLLGAAALLTPGELSAQEKGLRVETREASGVLGMSRENIEAQAEMAGVGNVIIDLETESGLYGKEFSPERIKDAKEQLATWQKDFSRYVDKVYTFTPREQLELIEYRVGLKEDEKATAQSNALLREKLLKAATLSFFYENNIYQKYQEQEDSTLLGAILTGNFDCNIGTAVIAHLNQITRLPLRALTIKRSGFHHVLAALELRGYSLPSLAIEATPPGVVESLYKYQERFPESQFVLGEINLDLIAVRCRELGVEFLKRGEIEVALLYIKKGVELAPNNYIQHVMLALGYVKAGDYRMALGAALRAEKLNNKDPDVYKVIAIAAERAGEKSVFEKADSIYQRMKKERGGK